MVTQVRPGEKPVTNEHAQRLSQGGAQLGGRVGAPAAQAAGREQVVGDVGGGDLVEAISLGEPVKTHPLHLPDPRQVTGQQRWQALAEPLHLAGEGPEFRTAVLRVHLARQVTQGLEDYVLLELGEIADR